MTLTCPFTLTFEKGIFSFFTFHLISGVRSHVNQNNQQSSLKTSNKAPFVVEGNPVIFEGSQSKRKSKVT